VKDLKVTTIREIQPIAELEILKIQRFLKLKRKRVIHKIKTYRFSDYQILMIKKRNRFTWLT